MKKFIFLTASLLILNLIICSCGQPRQNKDLGPSRDRISDTRDGDLIGELEDFPESIYDDIKSAFGDSGMTLSSLQRSSKGNVVKATIEEINGPKYVPKAILTLSGNFSSVDRMIIELSNHEEYSLLMTDFEDIKKNKEEDGGNLKAAIWDRITVKNKAANKTDSEDPTPQQAGI